jgi:acetylornithine deacetylase/succinyl-diaminopimelate desuccinylase-like protein
VTPFGGELVDGEVWGRGAVDMLDLTSSMAVAFRRLAKRGFRPRGTLIYLAVADEEALGSYGADWLLRNEQDAVRCDYVVTESGGFPLETPAGTRLPILVAEKGSFWATLRVRGTPGHASMPYGSDNALAKAGAVISRLAAYSPTPEISPVWRRFVADMGFAPELAAALVDPVQFGAGLAQLPYGLATEAHASRG